MKMKKGLKVFLVVFSVLLITILLSAGVAWATYWIGSVNPITEQSENIEVNIGKGKDLTDVALRFNTTNITDGSKKLVPVGKADLSAGGSAQNVEEFKVKVNILLATNSLTAPNTGFKKMIKLTLKDTDPIKINGAATHASLVLVDIALAQNTPSGNTHAQAEITLDDGVGVDFYVTIKLSEPATKPVYDAIINQQIVINLVAKEA